jgi:short-subunit dehydrogenase
MSPTALVTGPTAGIGRSFAHQLARQGHDLVLVARARDRLESEAAELRSSYGVQVEVLAADLTDRAELATVEARLADRARPVDLLVNNAGFGLKKRFLDNTVDEEQAMLEVLVTAVMRLSHAALGPMSERGSGGIINVSSVASFLPRGSYSAAKAWVNSFSEWAAHEYRPQGVTVTCLCPGFTKTEFHERMEVGRDSAPDFMWLDADQLVATALKDHAKGKAWSIPSPQYKAIATAARLVPTGVLQRFQSMGRK